MGTTLAQQVAAERLHCVVEFPARGEHERGVTEHLSLGGSRGHVDDRCRRGVGCDTRRVVWRTKVGPTPPVEHATRDDAEAHIAQLRARYRAGAASLRVVRLYDPDGGVHLVDFAAEVRDQSRALRDLERATAAKDRAVGEATARWEDTVRRVAALGSTPAR